MISIDQLSVQYQSGQGTVPALGGISIEISAGEIVTFIGPSGCGKSTLLHVLSGIVSDYSGRVRISGQAVNPKKQRIGLVPQNYGLLPWKTVRQNVLLGLTIKDGHARLDEYGCFLLKELGIDELLDRYPKELSGGQQQRVAIARAFIMKPDLLLMDEPFSALDAITREEIQALFLSIWQKHRVTTVFITHSVDEALYLGSRIVVFSEGPGQILEVVENPCFQLDNVRFKDDYYAMSVRLRSILNKG
ncbi:MAG: ABC transporter ATP-binding protein [Solirubrobacterales bacterium]